MNAEVKVKRGPKFESFTVACTKESSVSRLLELINMTIKDPIEWECSCNQNMCGACAMIINGRPRLACATFVRDIGYNITLEPLSKFPLIKDLKVDRSNIYRILQKVEAYPSGKAKVNTADNERQYLASSCLMCGCCMEVCPDYTGKDEFGSALVMNSLYRTISQEPDIKRKRELLKHYKKQQFIHCTKALSCADVCPLDLPQASMMSRLNHEMLKNMFKH